MKKILLSCLCVFIVITMVACNSKSKEKSADSSAGDKPYKGIKLVQLAESATGRAEAYKEFAKEFEEKTGAKVDVIDAPWEQLHDKIVNDLISKTGSIDVMDIDCGWDSETAPYMELLQPYIDKYKIDMSDYMDIYQKAVGVSSITKGQRYGLPLLGETAALFYRTDVLKDNGLEVPKTWEQFDEMLPKLQKDGFYPFVTAGVNIQLVKLFYARYVPQGKPLFDQNFVPQFNGSEGVKAVEGMKKLFGFAPKGILSMDNPDANQIFLNGQAAFLITWPTTVLTDLQDAGKSKIVDKWGVTAPPGPGNLGPYFLGLSKYSKNKDAAFEWMAFVTSKEKSKRMMLKYGNYSPRKSVWADPEVTKAIQGAAGVSEAIDKSFWPTIFVHPKGIEWFIRTGEELSQAMSGNRNAEDTVKAIANNWNEMFKSGKLPDGAIYEELKAK